MEWVRKLVLRKAALVYPVLPAPRTAALNPWFRPAGLVRVFERGWCAEAEAYRPGAVAATWDRLEPLLDSSKLTLTHAVIVLTPRGGHLLKTEQRQRLWRAFRVPVFEQIIGENGMLLAAECEAHEGLHIESSKFDGRGLRVETSPCGCGRKGPRLIRVEPAQEVRAAVAYAR